MKKRVIFTMVIIFTVLAYGIACSSNNVKANDINKKIGWGIKRNDNHEQPDLG